MNIQSLSTIKDDFVKQTTGLGYVYLVENLTLQEIARRERTFDQIWSLEETKSQIENALSDTKSAMEEAVANASDEEKDSVANEFGKDIASLEFEIQSLTEEINSLKSKPHRRSIVDIEEDDDENRYPKYEPLRIDKISHKQSDSIRKDKTIVFHSTRSGKELIDIIINKKFSAGSGGGAMLGKGFYANQHLYQAQKGNYGNYILQARILGISNFLFLDKEQYEEIHGPAGDDFVYDQIVAKGITEISKEFIENNKNFGSTARLASPLFDRFGSILKRKFGGLVYTGLYDKESVVCWYPEKQVVPLAWSDDKGATWKPANSIESYDRGSKEANLKGSESLRSYQRVKEFIKRYEKHSDDKLINGIKSHLSRIQDPAKKEARIEAFRKALSETRPSALSLL